MAKTRVHRAGWGSKIDFRDFIVGITVRKEVDEATGMEDIVVLEHRDEIHPQVLVRDPADRKNIPAPCTIPAEELLGHTLPTAAPAAEPRPPRLPAPRVAPQSRPSPVAFSFTGMDIHGQLNPWEDETSLPCATG